MLQPGIELAPTCGSYNEDPFNTTPSTTELVRHQITTKLVTDLNVSFI